jgi:hypothetical protein
MTGIRHDRIEINLEARRQFDLGQRGLDRIGIGSRLWDRLHHCRAGGFESGELFEIARILGKGTRYAERCSKRKRSRKSLDHHVPPISFLHSL